MNLPHRENAYVPKEKLTEYLLSETHPIGRFKARVLRRVGFDETNLNVLEQGLERIAREQEVSETVSTSRGAKFVIEGVLPTPAGGLLRLRTVWILDPDDDRPRFVTAYPR